MLKQKWEKRKGSEEGTDGKWGSGEVGEMVLPSPSKSPTIQQNPLLFSSLTESLPSTAYSDRCLTGLFSKTPSRLMLDTEVEFGVSLMAHLQTQPWFTGQAPTLTEP